MTFEQMQVEAELLYESINSGGAPGFNYEEWGQFFTIGQRRIVLNILKEGITKNTFNRLAIEKLILRDDYSDFIADSHFKNSDGSPAWILDNSTETFNSQFFWILDEYVDIGVGATLVTDIPVKHITYDFYRVNKSNPFRVPDSEEGYWILQYSGDIDVDNPTSIDSILPVIITDGEQVTGYHIVGVIHPDNYPIVSGTVYPLGGTHASCLNPSIHSKIVEEAVALARMSIVDPQGYQLALTDFNK